MGRPRKPNALTSTERSRRCRARQALARLQDAARKAKEHAEEQEQEALRLAGNRAAWDQHLRRMGLPMHKGLFLNDAPRGSAKLVSGGYSSRKIATVSDMHFLRSRNRNGDAAKTPESTKEKKINLESNQIVANDSAGEKPES